MLLFSDGDDQSSHASFEAAVARAESSDATIYVIGQGRAIRAYELRAVLKSSPAPAAARILCRGRRERLDRFFEEILEDLSNQYLISSPIPTRNATAVALDSSRGRQTASTKCAPERATGFRRTDEAAGR